MLKSWNIWKVSPFIDKIVSKYRDEQRRELFRLLNKETKNRTRNRYGFEKMYEAKIRFLFLALANEKGFVSDREIDWDVLIKQIDDSKKTVLANEIANQIYEWKVSNVERVDLANTKLPVDQLEVLLQEYVWISW